MHLKGVYPEIGRSVQLVFKISLIVFYHLRCRNMENEAEETNAPEEDYNPHKSVSLHDKFLLSLKSRNYTLYIFCVKHTAISCINPKRYLDAPA